jgi:hypothetical protein
MHVVCIMLNVGTNMGRRPRFLEMESAEDICTRYLEPRNISSSSSSSNSIGQSQHLLTVGEEIVLSVNQVDLLASLLLAEEAVARIVHDECQSLEALVTGMVQSHQVTDGEDMAEKLQAVTEQQETCFVDDTIEFAASHVEAVVQQDQLVDSDADKNNDSNAAEKDNDNSPVSSNGEKQMREQEVEQQLLQEHGPQMQHLQLIGSPPMQLPQCMDDDGGEDGELMRVIDLRYQGNNPPQDDTVGDEEYGGADVDDSQIDLTPLIPPGSDEGYSAGLCGTMTTFHSLPVDVVVHPAVPHCRTCMNPHAYKTKTWSRPVYIYTLETLYEENEELVSTICTISC